MPTAVDLRHRVAITDHPLASEVLTDDVLAFLVGLHERFGPCRSELLSRHQAATARHRDGERPTYDAETAYIRSNEWHIAPAPRDLVDRRTELVGLVSRPALVEGLNSGAQVYMADFEDTITPERRKFEAGRGNLFFTSPTPRTGEQGLDPVLSKEDMQMSEGLGWGQWALILLGVLTGLYLLTALVVL